MAYNWIHLWRKQKPNPRRPQTAGGARENPQTESASVGAGAGAGVGAIVVVATKENRLCRQWLEIMEIGIDWSGKSIGEAKIGIQSGKKPGKPTQKHNEKVCKRWTRKQKRLKTT